MTSPRRRARRRTPALTILAGLVLIVASCGGDGPPERAAGAADTTTTSTTAAASVTTTTWAMGEVETEYVGEGPRVSVVGDSLTVSSRDDLVAALDGYRLKVAALRGEGLTGGPISTGFGQPMMATSLATDAEDPPDVLVFALGTNDAWRDDRTVDQFDVRWRRMLEQLPGTCIVGVTLADAAPASPRYDPAEAAHINDLVRADVDVVVDWAAEGSDPRFTDPFDTIHLTPEGTRLRTRLIAEGVDECLARGGG